MTRGHAYRGAELLPDRAQDWRDQAACRDEPELFFLDDHTGTVATLATEEAKRICHTCPVQEECLTWAIQQDEPWGVWGGQTTNERHGRTDKCRDCDTPIPYGSEARYCDRCRSLARIRRNRDRAKMKEHAT